MKVFVYRNLHKKCWSVRNVKTGRVIAHIDTILLTNAKFKVSEAGRQRVIKEKRKNVHAGVQGEWLESEKNFDGFVSSVKYNPYKNPYFIDENNNPVFESDLVLLSNGKVWNKSREI